MEQKFIHGLNEKFKFGTEAQGPGNILFYGLNIVPNECFTCSIIAEDKLQALQQYPITRLRRLEFYSEITAVEKSAFMSLNSSLGWLGISAFPFWEFYNSYLQNMLPTSKGPVMGAKSSALRILQNESTNISLPKPKNGGHTVSIAIFSNSGRLSDHGQRSYIYGFFIGPLSIYSVFHDFSWMSNKSKRPVRSIVATKILSTSEATDEGTTLKVTFSLFTSTPVRLVVIVN